jgi:hypothetical protein
MVSEIAPDGMRSWKREEEREILSKTAGMLLAYAHSLGGRLPRLVSWKRRPTKGGTGVQEDEE